MPMKCTVWGCRTGYKPRKHDEIKTEETQVKHHLYQFPKDLDECQDWLSALPNTNLKLNNVTKNMAICSLHWPQNMPKEKYRFSGRHLVPNIPPSIFPKLNSKAGVKVVNGEAMVLPKTQIM